MLRLTKVPIGLRGHAPSNQRMDPMGRGRRVARRAGTATRCIVGFPDRAAAPQDLRALGGSHSPNRA